MLNHRYLILALSAVLNLVLLWALIWGGNGIVAYRLLHGENQELSRRVGALNEKNLELSKEIRLLLSDEKYLEQVIRGRLNFVKDDEILYIFPDKPDARADGAVNESKN